MIAPRKDKPLAWLRGEIKSPPFGIAARVEAGYLLRRLQAGEMIGLPMSRPMPAIGRGVTSSGSMTQDSHGASSIESTKMRS